MADVEDPAAAPETAEQPPAATAAGDASPRAAWAEGGKPKLDPLKGGKPGHVEVALKGTGAALALVPVSANATLADLRVAIQQHARRGVSRSRGGPPRVFFCFGRTRPDAAAPPRGLRRSRGAAAGESCGRGAAAAAPRVAAAAEAAPRVAAPPRRAGLWSRGAAAGESC